MQVVPHARAVERRVHAFELEDQVVAEGAIEAEERILEANEILHQPPDRTEHRGLQAALFLGEQVRGLGDAKLKVARRLGRDLGFLATCQHGFQQSEEPLTSFVEGVHPDGAAGGEEFERRFDHAKIEA